MLSLFHARLLQAWLSIAEGKNKGKPRQKNHGPPRSKAMALIVRCCQIMP